MKILLFLFLKLCGALVLVGLTVWGIFALQFQVSDLALRFALMLLWVGLALLGLYVIFLGTAWFALPYLVGSLVLGVWWNSIEPSNGRRWAQEVERVSYGQVQGTIVTMHNVRDFVWRSENDFDERWQTRQYDLERLSSVDMFLSYWMGPSIAHTLVSFGFSDGQ
ncbi:MAG TPA: DUF4105 domain-containing protein, partial [Alcaligenes faecalis]|nr:DUF4105 domain-containing protein [Alcaligenes faecalis]